MAGAGKRTFIAGEVLTAAQVNDYLMDQAVMRFSGSAARAASIAAPSEGMVTYLDDSNVLEYYDGSAWIPVVPQDQIDGKIPASLITGSAQVLIGVDAASLISIGASVDGQVLTANASVPGGITWQAIPGAGQSAWCNVSTASTNIGMTTSLEPGFYKISTSGSQTFTSAQFRFVASDGSFYGASLNGGAGFFTIPATVASINATVGTPFTVLIEEVPGVTAILEEGPSVSNLNYSGLIELSFSASATPTATDIGFWHTDTGSFQVLPTSASLTGTASAVTSSLGFDVAHNLRFAQRSSQGIWSTATTASTRYPFIQFNANGTYVPPPWSSSADVLVVAGGGGGGGVNLPSPSPLAGGAGGGGAGGLTLLLAQATPGSVAITVGSAGTGGATGNGTNGGNSLFGSASVAGGGFGSSGPGGSGGGAFSNGTAGTGISGQGNPGGAPVSTVGAGGGGGGAGSAGVNDVGGSASIVFGQAFAAGGPATSSGTASPGGSKGNGGQGARRTTTGSTAGGNGGVGVVIVKARA